jgi:hypothetical protein
MLMAFVLFLGSCLSVAFIGVTGSVHDAVQGGFKATVIISLAKAWSHVLRNYFAAKRVGQYIH